MSGHGGKGPVPPLSVLRPIVQKSVDPVSGLFTPTLSVLGGEVIGKATVG